jgi:hypothetical protein
MKKDPVIQLRDDISTMSIDPKKRKYEPKTSIISKNTNTEEPDIKKVKLMNQHERHKAIIERHRDDPVAERKREKYLKSLNDPDNIAAFERNKKMITDERENRSTDPLLFDDTELDINPKVIEYIKKFIRWINEAYNHFIISGRFTPIILEPREIKLVSEIYYKMVELHPELCKDLNAHNTLYVALYYYLSSHIDSMNTVRRLFKSIFGRIAVDLYKNTTDPIKQKERYNIISDENRFKKIRDDVLKVKGPLMDKLIFHLVNDEQFSDIRKAVMGIKGGKKQTKKRKPTKRRKTSKNRK